MPDAKDTTEKKHVLIINSYNPGYLWSDLEMEGIKSVFNASPNIQLHYEYLDTKRVFDKQHLLNVYKLFKHKFSRDRFDLILVSDNDAFEFIKKYRNKLFFGVPVVFCGINDYKDSMLKGQKKITGVIEVIDYKASIEVALKLRPSAKQVIVVSDRTKTGIAHENIVRGLIPEFQNRAKFVFLSLGNMTMKEMQEKLGRLEDDSLVLLLAHFKDKTGHVFSVQESVELLTKSSSVPCFVVTGDRVGLGVVGGMVVSGFYQGETAAKMALRILNGEPIEKIQVLKQSPNKYMFDYAGMKRWGIDEEYLPKGSIIKNRPYSFYRANELLVWSVICVFLLFALIIIALLSNIIRRRRIEATLLKKEERLSSIIETIPEGITIVDYNGKITFANKTAEAILRLEKSKLAERTYNDPAWNIAAIDGNFFPEEELPFAKVMRTKQPVFNIEHAIEHFDKTKTLLSINAAPLHDVKGNISGMIASITDITERKRAEEALRSITLRTEAILAAIPDIIMEVDNNKIYTWANKAGYEFFGDDVIGKEADLYFEGEQKTYNMVSPLFAGSEDIIYVESWQRRRDGERRLLAWWCRVLKDLSGTVIGALSTARDITERRHTEEALQEAYTEMEEKIKERTAELTEANAKLKELDRLKSMFIASMSHELRTPLNSVIGFSSIILNEWMGPLNKEQKQNLSSVLRSGKHLLALINDVIDVSKIEAGMIDINIEDFDLDPVIQEAVNVLKHEIQDKKLKLKVESIHQIMHTDKRRLLQAVMNLISNAVKFTEKGSVSVKSTFVTPSFIEISVEDTGIGIKEEDIPRLFSAFTRLDSHLKSTVSGTGLGLYLTKKLVQDILKGGIMVESKEGKGSRFTIRIPVTL